MTREELINQRKKEIAELTSQINKSEINYNLPMGSWVSHKESEISDRERMTIDEAIETIKGNKWIACSEKYQEAMNLIETTISKYQKIQEAMDSRPDDSAKSNSKVLSKIEVIMYGNDDN